MNQKLTHSYLLEKGVQTLFSLFCILCAIYCVILISIVFSVIERKQATLSANNLTNSLMQIENNYAGALSTLDDKALADRGFHRFEATQFAVRKDPIATYAFLYAR
jgi:hypothetical protein